MARQADAGVERSGCPGQLERGEGEGLIRIRTLRRRLVEQKRYHRVLEDYPFDAGRLPDPSRTLVDGVAPPILPEQAFRWRAVPRDALAVREWGGEFVIRNDLSGSTHLLAEGPGRVLLALCESEAGVTISDMLQKLNSEGHAIDEKEWIADLEAILSEFERLGLAERQLS